MDEVTSKLKKLFKSKPKSFKGQGQKLGQTASTASSAPARAPQSYQRAYPQQPPARGKPSPAVSNRQLGLQSAPVAERFDIPPASVVTTGAYIVPDDESPTEAQQEASVLLSSAPRRTAAAEILSKVLRNIVEHPTEPKYRKLKLNNKKVEQAVVNVDGGLELLQASGFELVFEDSSPEPQAAATPPPTGSPPPQNSIDSGVSPRESQSSAGWPIGEASSQGTNNTGTSGQNHSGTATLAESGSEAAVEAAPAESAMTGYLWFPEEAELSLLQAALQLLRPLTPLPFSKSIPKSGAHRLPQSAVTDRGSTASSSTASSSTTQAGAPESSQPAHPMQTPLQTPAMSALPESSIRSRGELSAAHAAAAAHSSSATSLAEPRLRKTQVLLPEPTDTQVPDWLFQQSGMELKQAYAAAKKRREMDSMLMTRAYREKLAGGKTQKGMYIYAVIRVRLPEGLLLQGEFNAREPVTAIFEWVSDSLRDPGQTYDLILPSRRPLEASMGTVSEADLLPAALLNLMFSAPVSGQQEMPSLSPSLLQQVE
ncbi:hypothetical protein ABBQ38_014034 [Trebouxia sp. C0009 RCD-2024]